MAEPTSYETLVERIRSGDRQSVIRAAHQLGDSGDRRAVPILMSLLTATTDGGIRNAAAVGLRELHDQRALPVLTALIKHPKTEGNRGTLVHALQGLDCRTILPDLVDLVIQGNWEVSREAVMAIESTTQDIPPAVLDECMRKIREALPHASGDTAVMLSDLKDLFEGAE